MTKTMYDVLDAHFEESPVLVAGPAASPEIDTIEEFAGFSLPSCYKGFVTRYGGAIVGAYSVFGWGASIAMGSDEISVIEVTNRFRSDHWPGSESSLVISIDHSGNAIMLDRSGSISMFDHDYGVAEVISKDFEQFIVEWCLKIA